MRKKSFGKDLEIGEFLAFDIPSYDDNLGFDKSDSDEEGKIDTPAQDFAEYQKKQAALMQRRRSSISYTRISENGGRRSMVAGSSFAVKSRQGSISCETSYGQKRSNSIDVTSSPNSISSQGNDGGSAPESSLRRPSTSLAVPKGASFAGKRLSIALPATSETDNENEAVDVRVTLESQPENISSLEESMSIPSSTKVALKSKKFLVTSVIPSEKSVPIAPNIVGLLTGKRDNTLGAIKESSSTITASRKDILPPLHKAENSLNGKNDEFAEVNVKKALSGVVPMGYHELKELSHQVSSLTHKLRMHHDVSEVMDDLIADEKDLELALGQSLADLPSSLPDMQQTSPPNYEKNKSKIENALFSNVEACQLPTKLSPLELMQNQCSTNMKSILKPVVLRSWLKCLKSKVLEKLVRQIFWYIWHVLYKPQEQETTQTLLLANISVDYVGLLVSISIPRKDYFFLKLQDFLSFCLIRLFEDSFPDSTEISDAAFKSDVCSKVCVLLSGITPSYLPSENWEKKAETVQVKATKTEDAKEQKRRALMQILTSAKCLEDPVSLDEKVIDKDFVIVEKQADSSFYGDQRKGHNVNFNLYQNSPLVSQYLQEVSKKKKLIIKRIEICKDEPPKHLKTYRDIIEESKKDSKKRNEEFRRNQERIIKERVTLSI